MGRRTARKVERRKGKTRGIKREEKGKGRGEIDGGERDTRREKSKVI